MSILWLEPFIFDPTMSNIFTFQSLNIVIYLNMTSIVCFVLYCMIYKMDLNMQKPPNTLIIWKMFGECLISIHFLLLFLCFAVENNKRKLEHTKVIMLLVSLIAPVGIFLVYFFTACLAQNLYTTFYAYKNDFDKRMQKYKLYALIGGVIVFGLSCLFHKGYQSTISTVQFTISFYPFFYVALIYFAGGIGMVFIIYKTIYVVNRKDAFFSFLNFNRGGEDSFRKNLVSLFVKRHLAFCYVFIICYLPNNIILLLQIFLSYKICTDCRIFAFAIYMISLSCTFSFMIKMTEPYMKKYFQVMISFIFKKDLLGPEGTDYSTLYNDKGDNFLNKEMDVYESKKDIEKNNEENLNVMADTIEIVTREMQSNDFYKSMVGIIITIHDDEIYDQDAEFLRLTYKFLPWDQMIYKEKTKFMNYDNTNLPEWLMNFEESKNKII